MNIQSFTFSTLAGFVVYFLLGWLFYGVLFTDIYSGGGKENMVFIALGCLFYAVLLAFIFNQWAGISNPITGLKAGAIFGLLFGLTSVMFYFSTNDFNATSLFKELIASSVSGSLTGGAIAFVIGKTKK